VSIPSDDVVCPHPVAQQPHGLDGDLSLPLWRDLRGDGRANPFDKTADKSRPSKPRSSSPLTHSSMVIFVHVGTDLRQLPIAQSALRHSRAGSGILLPGGQHNLRGVALMVVTTPART
jgi:hypothetical protein